MNEKEKPQLRELDAEIAKILGWTEVGKYFPTEHIYGRHPEDNDKHRRSVPHYSSDMNSAYALLQKMDADGYALYFDKGTANNESLWYVATTGQHVPPVHFLAETLPLAIAIMFKDRYQKQVSVDDHKQRLQRHLAKLQKIAVGLGWYDMDVKNDVVHGKRPSTIHAPEKYGRAPVPNYYHSYETIFLILNKIREKGYDSDIVRPSGDGEHEWEFGVEDSESGIGFVKYNDSLPTAVCDAFLWVLDGKSEKEKKAHEATKAQR